MRHKRKRPAIDGLGWGANDRGDSAIQKIEGVKAPCALCVINGKIAHIKERL
jgi:hypothetical protein